MSSASSDKTTSLRGAMSLLLGRIKKIRRSTWVALIMASGPVVIYFLAQLIAVVMISLAGLVSGVSVSFMESWFGTTEGQFITYLVVAITGFWMIHRLIRRLGISWSKLGMKRPRPVDALYALAGYGWYLPTLYIASFAISILLPSLDFEQRQQLGFSTSTGGLELLMIGIALVVIPPLYEEVLCRGLLFTGLRKRLSLWPAAIITSVLFAAAHLQWGSSAPLLWAAAVDTLLLSMILAYMREKTGSLWPGIGLHAIKNGVAFTLLFVLKIG